MTLVSALYSCHRVEVESDEILGAICFGVSDSDIDMDVATKAYSENTVTQVQNNGFKVAGIVNSTGTKVTMFNCHATWSSPTSCYNPDGGPFYYPVSDNMNFYAVYPSSQNITISSGAATLAYTQNMDTDLLASKALNVASQASPVALTFDHIKSLLHFKAVGTDPYAMYKVTGITVTAPNGGTYSYASNSWTASSTNGSYVYSSATTTLSGTTTIAGAMTLVPCTPSVTVTWDCYSLDGATKVAAYSVTKSLGDALLIGKDTTVTLRLPNSSAVPITFSVTVSSWGTPVEREVIFSES